MKSLRQILLASLVIFLSGAAWADEASSSDNAPRKSLRDEWKHLSPEQKRARVQKFREERGPKREGLEKLRDELKSLPRSERRAKLQEWREQKIAELKKKKEAGTLTRPEQKLLDRAEHGPARHRAIGPEPKVEGERSGGVSSSSIPKDPAPKQE